MDETLTDPLVIEFCAALTRCRKLYRNGARHCIRYHPEFVPKSPQEFLELMDDLHRGLVVKVYLTTALIDHRWSTRERLLAQALFEHAWSRHLEGQELREVVRRLSNDVSNVSWYSLLRPFAEIEPLKEHVGDLETVVLRIANIVIKADGKLAPSEEQFLRTLQEEMDRHLRPIPLEDRPPHQHVRHRGSAAVKTMRKDVTEIRTQCQMPAEPIEGPTELASEERLEQLLNELDNLIGLARVKGEIRTLANFLKLQRHREKSGLPQTNVSLHMVFEGNPGTGKTTVARLVAQIFQAMGILQKGHLVETDRSGLVAEYAGQTGPKTNTRIDESLDGVLFIDEAYSLVASEGDDAFGREALQTLLKRMEDDRDRLVVILAGYPEPMDGLIRTNPGLSSRFSRKLRFEDYSPTELCSIFACFCQDNQYELSPIVRVRLMLGFEAAYRNRDEHFGNGRLARNVFENAIRQVGNRIAGISTVTHKLLTCFHPEDVQLPKVDANVLSRPPESLNMTIRCPGCEKSRAMNFQMLGRRVRCRDCQHVFTADWGDFEDNTAEP